MIIDIQLEQGGKSPEYQTDGSAGLDLFTSSKDLYYIAPNEYRLVDTAVKIAIPEGFVGLVIERSSLHTLGLSLANSVGVIDSDYRGTIRLSVLNKNQHIIAIEPSTRLAQLLIVPVPRVTLNERLSLDDTCRGEGGFGSTNELA